MRNDNDLNVEWNKLEDEFMEVNLMADMNLHQQLHMIRVTLKCQFALLDRMEQQQQCDERRVTPLSNE